MAKIKFSCIFAKGYARTEEGGVAVYVALVSAVMIGFGAFLADPDRLFTLLDDPDHVVRLETELQNAVEATARAANQGDADAQYNLGAMYFMGRGVPQDHAEAEKWYRKAAEQGHANALRNLNFMYKKGRSPQRKAALATASVDFHVQLGAVRSKVHAVKEADRLISLHKRTLGTLTIVPVRTDLGSRGVYYRLRVGPFPDSATADSLCRKLSARQQNCIVVKP